MDTYTAAAKASWLDLKALLPCVRAEAARFESKIAVGVQHTSIQEAKRLPF